MTLLKHKGDGLSDKQVTLYSVKTEVGLTLKPDADDSTSPCQFRRKASKLRIQVGSALKTNDDKETTLLLVVTARISCRRRKLCK